MISVVIPALDVSATVSAVVKLALADPRVSEVIVVDDGSIDGTPELAEAAGARVVTSTLLGKGASMLDGLNAARNDLLIYLDGDLSELRQDLIARLAGPLLNGVADFVKARFSREAGRVTALTARPLLQTFFPELNHIEQPLGGIIAARRSLLERLRFEDDYGVDVGLLLDAARLGARLVQVHIGHIEHDNQPLQALGDMASQVMRVILDRASRDGRLSFEQVRETQEAERRRQAGLPVIMQKVAHAERLALLDMDGVTLDGRFIVELARRTFKTSALSQYLDNPKFSAESRMRMIASLFAGVSRDVFTQTAHEMPLTPGAIETVVGLRKLGYRVGLVTDSFFVVSEIARRRVFADFSVAHLMKFSNDKATGEATITQAMTHHPRGCGEHRICKLNVLRHLAGHSGFALKDVIAVGDGENDICLLRAVPLSFAFRPKSESVRAAARYVIEDSLLDLLGVVHHNLSESLPYLYSVSR
ncbi:MAG TPA: glycosyltransferase [Blastocatellia bacterium]|jgi:phosphoserine phosphatase|nr:glycosyltransferase [Blastocatellia bacterium]